MRLVIAAGVLLFLLPAAMLAQPCDPVKCASQTKIASEPFCSNDDVYAAYQEYYCSGNECASRTTERLIEDCRLGCVIGSCITCEQKACEAKSGFYGSRYCRDNSVYRPYREYFCETGMGCTFSETNRLVESCSSDTTCSQGTCGLCDPANCKANSNFYGDDFCNLGKVYRQYRDYHCSGDRCDYYAQDIKLAECAYGCDENKCALPNCEPGCDSKDAFTGEPYCKGTSVYRSFRNYFCGTFRCEFNETEKKVADCQSCSSGQCVVTRTTNERLFEFDVNFSASKTDKNVSVLPDRIFSGILFGSNDVKINANALVRSISFDVLETNGLGELRVFADSRNILNASRTGHYDVAVNRSVKQLAFSAASSGFIFWMPSVYDLGIISVAVTEEKQKINEFSFQLGRAELDNMKSAEIVAKPANTQVTINGMQVSHSDGVARYLAIDNSIEFIPLSNETFSGKGVIKIVYEN